MYEDGTEYSYREVLKGLVRKSKVEVGPPSDPDDDIAKTKYFYGADGDIEAVLPPDPQGLIRYDTDTLNRIYRITDAAGTAATSSTTSSTGLTRSRPSTPPAT